MLLNTQNSMNTSVRIIEDEKEREAYDACAIHPMQSWAWGDVRIATGIRVVRFGRYDGERLSAVYQMTVHKLPKVSFFIGYIPRSGIPDKETESFLADWARKEKIIFIKWEPYQELASDMGHEKLSDIFSSMRISHHPLFTEWNQEVDLTASADEILKRFKKNTRYSIRHAEQAGVTTCEMSTDEGFQIFADLYFSTANRQKYHGHTRKYHETIWRVLSRAGIARIFVAYYEGKPHAAYEIFFWHDRAYYPYSGSSSTDRHIPATQYLMWHVIQEAKKSGAKTLDLWGSLPPEYDKKHPWAGFTLFKSGFGTRFVHMHPSTDQVIFGGLYRLYSIAYMLRALIWKGGIV